jgi:hypothetical protein
MNLINTQQGIINTWHKELNQRMRVLPVHIKIEGLSEAKKDLDNAWFFYNSNTQTTWNRFKSYIPFTLPNRLKNIYWHRAEIVKNHLAILDRRITEMEREPVKTPVRRATAPDLMPVVYKGLFTYVNQPKKTESFNHLPRHTFS